MSQAYFDVYDPVQQSTNLKAAIQPAVRDYHARLRLDAFFSGSRVILTDAQIFDGPAFIEIAANGGLKDLPASQLKIVSRANNLEDAFLEFIAPKGADKPKTLWLSAVPDRFRDLVRREFPVYGPQNIRHWTDVLKMLKAVGVAPDDVDRLGAGWGRWFEFKGVTVEEWNKKFDWNNKFSDRLQLSSLHAFRSTNEPAGHDAIKKTLDLHKRGSNRAAIVAELDKCLSQVPPESEDAEDIRTVLDWYNRCYNATAAEQHDCIGRGSSPRGRGWRLSRLLKLGDSVWDALVEPAQSEHQKKLFPITLPEKFTDHLAAMSIDSFNRVQKEQKESISIWRKQSSETALSTAVYDLVEAANKTGGGSLSSVVSSDILGAGYLFPIASATGVAIYWLTQDLSTAGQGAAATGVTLDGWLSPAKRAERRILEIADAVYKE